MLYLILLFSIKEITRTMVLNKIEEPLKEDSLRINKIHKEDTDFELYLPWDVLLDMGINSGVQKLKLDLSGTWRRHGKINISSAVTSFPKEEIDKICIKYIYGDIKIRITETDSIKIKTSARLTKKDKKLVIEGSFEKKELKGFWYEKNMRTRIEAPAGIEILANIISGNAEIYFSSAEEKETEIKLQTLNGDIRVDGEKLKGRVDMELSVLSGDIELYFAPEGEVELSASSGDITVSADPLKILSAEYRIRTLSGNIYCTNLIAKKVKLSTFSGNIMLGADDTAERCKDCRYFLETISGEIEKNIPSWMNVEEKRIGLKFPEFKIPQLHEYFKFYKREIPRKDYLKKIPPLMPWLFSPLSYNRVEGVRLGLSPSFGKEKRKLTLGFSYGFWAKKWNLWALLSEDFVPQFGISFSIFDCIATPDRWKIKDTENSIFSFLFRQDVRDYYREKGFTFSLNFKIPKTARASLIYENGSIQGERKNTEWSLLPLHDSFPDNPWTEKRNIEFLHLLSEAGFKNFYLQLLFSDSKDFIPDGFYRILFKTVVWFDFSGTRLSLRGVSGYSPDSLYFPYDFRIGGIATLPGYFYNEFKGNKFWLLNLEYNIGFKEFDVILFADAGSVGFQRIRTDAGVGIGIPWLGVSVRAVRPIKTPEKMSVYIRWRERF